MPLDPNSPYGQNVMGLMNNTMGQVTPDMGDPMQLASAYKNRQQQRMNAMTASQGFRANGGQASSPIAQHIRSVGQADPNATIPPDALTAQQPEANLNTPSAYTPAMAEADDAKGGANVQIQRGIGPGSQESTWNSKTLQETTSQDQGRSNFLSSIRQGLNQQDSDRLGAFGAAGGTPEQMMNQRNAMEKSEKGPTGAKKSPDEQLLASEMKYGDTLVDPTNTQYPGTAVPQSPGELNQVHQQQLDLYRQGHPGKGPEQGMQQGTQGQPSAKTQGWNSPDGTVHPEGTTLKSQSTGRMFMIKDGQPVEIPNG